MSDQTNQTSDTQPSAAQKAQRFISLRWRLTVPIALIVMVVAMIGAYVIARNLSGGFAISETNLLLQSTRSATERSVERYTRLRAEAQRIAFTNGIAEAITSNTPDVVLPSLEASAANANLDSVILLDVTGLEVLGLLKIEDAASSEYAVSTGSVMTTQPIIIDTLSNGEIGASGLSRTSQGMLLYVAYPILVDESVVGVALVGQKLATVLADIDGSAVADVTLYEATGTVLQTSFSLTDESAPNLAVDRTTIDQALQSDQIVVAPSISLGNATYRASYSPFVFGGDTLGVLAVFVPNSVPFVTELGRQMISLFAAALAGAAVTAIFTGVVTMVNRMTKIQQTAQELAAGKRLVRTGLRATDEVGAIGQALDQYAELAVEREDQLQRSLRKQRRERTYFESVVESMPGGIVVQDIEGNVILMNSSARELLSSTHEPGLDDQDTAALNKIIVDELGGALAPGVYSLGDPQRIGIDDRMLQAQAAAVVSTATEDERLGTVIALNDVTESIRREQAHEKMLDELSKDIQQPLAGLAQTGAISANANMSDFAREVSRHAATLQKMIVDMRELTIYSSQVAERVQRPLLLETLVWSVANDWLQIAQAADIALSVIIDKQGLHILGDESRLRWAIGNIVDNAIKYNPAGGALTIEIKDDVDGMAHLRVRDNGVGILDKDMPHVFTRFYRGTPTAPDGEELVVPGMGQGLTVAKQIIESHGGNIQVRSKLGVGTAMYFSLPLTAALGYELPLLDIDVMEGETIAIPQDADVDMVWQKKDR